MILGFVLGWLLATIIKAVMAPGGNLGGDLINYPQAEPPVKFSAIAIGTSTYPPVNGVIMGGNLVVGGSIQGNSTRLIDNGAGLANNAAANTATLTNAPTAGNPTKWVPINDNGTTRNIPCW